MKISWIARLTVLAALIMFFCPFMMVSCEPLEVEETYSGVNFMLKNADGDILNSKIIEDAEFEHNYWLIGAFVLGAVTLLLLFVKRARLVAAFTALASTVMLVLFRVTFYSFYDIEDFKEVKDVIIIETMWGFIACVALMFITTILAVINYIKHRRDDFY